jgi:membrane protein required for colicin V production
VNQLDAVLLVLLVPFALRGYWRGFCREGLGLVGLFAGAFAAAAFGPRLAEALIAHQVWWPAAALPLAYLVIFTAVWMAAAVLGMVADRIARALFLGGVNRIGGAILGSAKGAAVLGFILLLAARAPGMADTIETSRLGRPLMQLAGSVLDTGHLLHERSAGQHV